MTDTIIIRQAGPYTVTSDGNSFYVDGVRQALSTVFDAAPGAIAFMLDTGCIGANGKPDVVGLRMEHYRAHQEFGRTVRGEVAPAQVTPAEIERVAAERAFDLASNEGGEGFNPHRVGAAPTYRSGASRDRDYPAGA